MCGASYASSSSHKDLMRLKKEIAQQQDKGKKLTEQSQDIDRKVALYRKTSAKLAQIIQYHQRQLFLLREKFKDLDVKRSQEDQEWQKSSQDIFSILAALQRLSQAGMQAFLIYPYHPLKSVESSVVLSSLPPSLKGKVLALQKEIQHIITVQEQMKKTIMQIETEMGIIKKQSTELDKTLQALSAMERQNTKQREEHKQYMNTLMKRANNLEQLLSSIQKESNKLKQNETKAPSDKNSKNAGVNDVLRPFASSGVQVPLTGKVVEVFGQRLKFGEISKGIAIQSSPGSLVVSPYDGVVMFAGNFHDHGMIVIIRHQGGYYSVLTGMTVVKVASGDHVVEGQPIGNLGAAGDDVISLVKGVYVNPILHYQLLYKGKAINPFLKISRKSLDMR